MCVQQCWDIWLGQGLFHEVFFAAFDDSAWCSFMIPEMSISDDFGTFILHQPQIVEWGTCTRGQLRHHMHQCSGCWCHDADGWCHTSFQHLKDEQISDKFQWCEQKRRTESAVTNSDIDPIRRSSINAALINDEDDEVQTVYESLNFPNQPKRHPCFSNFRAAAGSEHGLDSLVAQGVVVDVDRHWIGESEVLNCPPKFGHLDWSSGIGDEVEATRFSQSFNHFNPYFEK